MKRALLYDLNPTGHCPSWLHHTTRALLDQGLEVVLGACLDNEGTRPWIDPLRDFLSDIIPVGREAKSGLAGAIREMAARHRCGGIFFPNLDSILFRLGRDGVVPEWEKLRFGGIILRPDHLRAESRSHAEALWRKLWRSQANKRLRKEWKHHRQTARGFDLLMGRSSPPPIRAWFGVGPRSHQKLRQRLGGNESAFALCDPWVSRAEEGKEEARRLLGLPQDKTLFLHAGTSRPEKGLADACQALLRLHRESSKASQVRLLRAGPTDPSETAWMKLVQEKGLWIGWDRYLSQRELDLCFAAADWTLLPYRRQAESSGILVNAAAHGCPILASDFGEIGEAVRNGNLGLVFRHEDTADLGRVLAKALETDASFDAPLQKFAQAHSPDAFRSQLVEGLHRAGWLD